MAEVTKRKKERDGLTELETYWRDLQQWLQDCGYMLRPRYMPDWTPSWHQNGLSPLKCEDGQPLRAAHIVCDATRLSDGARVVLKLIHPSVHPHEVEIATFLSSEALAADPKNHCVPIYEVLRVPNEDDEVLIVMPLLRPWDSPPFKTVGEAVDFFAQLFQGLQFMHKHHVAHRDISEVNVMMDGSQFPEGWHFCTIDQDRQHPFEPAKYYTRLQCPPRYYFTDFGISRRYDPKDGPPLEPPIHGGDRTVPEFQKSIAPCDPFPTDIYYVGNLIREGILQKYRGFGFMQRLISDMVQDDPAKRPMIGEVVARFEAIQKNLGNLKLHSRAASRKEWFGPVRDFAHFFKSVKLVVQKVPPIPSRSSS